MSTCISFVSSSSAQSTHIYILVSIVFIRLGKINIQRIILIENSINFKITQNSELSVTFDIELIAENR